MTPEGSTLYIAAFGVLAELANPGAAGQKWTEYLSVGSAKVGMRSIQTASRTILGDILASTACMVRWVYA